MGHSVFEQSTLNIMKGFIIFALLIVGVYSGQLHEIRLNIRDASGCGSPGRLGIKIIQPTTWGGLGGGSICETLMKPGIEQGETIVWSGRNLGYCNGVDFDQNAQFSLVYDGNTDYCPSLIEFLARRPDSYYRSYRGNRNMGGNDLDSFKKKMNEGRTHRFNRNDNDQRHTARPNAVFVIGDNYGRCLTQEQGACPVNELHAVRRAGHARKQCIFQCNFIGREQGQGRQMKNVGELCHEVTYQVQQYDYCCNRPGTGFDVCQAPDSNWQNGNTCHIDDWECRNRNRQPQNQNDMVHGNGNTAYEAYPEDRTVERTTESYNYHYDNNENRNRQPQNQNDMVHVNGNTAYEVYPEDRTVERTTESYNYHYDNNENRNDMVHGNGNTAHDAYPEHRTVEGTTQYYN